MIEYPRLADEENDPRYFNKGLDDEEDMDDDEDEFDLEEDE